MSIMCCFCSHLFEMHMKQAPCCHLVLLFFLFFFPTTLAPIWCYSSQDCSECVWAIFYLSVVAITCSFSLSFFCGSFFFYIYVSGKQNSTTSCRRCRRFFFLQYIPKAREKKTKNSRLFSRWKWILLFFFLSFLIFLSTTL